MSMILYLTGAAGLWVGIYGHTSCGGGKPLVAKSKSRTLDLIESVVLVISMGL